EELVHRLRRSLDLEVRQRREGTERADRYDRQPPPDVRGDRGTRVSGRGDEVGTRGGSGAGDPDVVAGRQGVQPGVRSAAGTARGGRPRTTAARGGQGWQRGQSAEYQRGGEEADEHASALCGQSHEGGLRLSLRRSHSPACRL